MKRKKLIKIQIIFIFITFTLTFFIHNGYELFNKNFLLIPFFPVNESLFEHLKIFYTSYLISDFIKYFILKKNDIIFNNYKISILINIISSIIIFLSIYLPINLIIKHSLIITLILLFISISLTSFINYKILINNNFQNINNYSYLILLLILFILTYFTFNPLKTNFFIDKNNNKIGLKNLY